MEKFSRLRVLAVAAICFCFSGGLAVSAQSHPDASASRKESVMAHANGTFEVKITPQPTDDKDSGLGRMSIDKQFHGDLEGTSKGEMLTGMTNVKGSAGYVAMEKVRGTLQGKRGTFILQHTGTMDRGAAQLSVTVVPDSGTDELVGVSGTLTIKVVDGKHFYDFEYAIAKSD